MGKGSIVKEKGREKREEKRKEKKRKKMGMGNKLIFFIDLYRRPFNSIHNTLFLRSTLQALPLPLSVLIRFITP